MGEERRLTASGTQRVGCLQGSGGWSLTVPALRVVGPAGHQTALLSLLRRYQGRGVCGPRSHCQGDSDVSRATMRTASLSFRRNFDSSILGGD